MNKHKFNILPEATEEDFQKIVADIRAHGYDASQPVVLYQGDILDGWHRYRAATEAGVAYPTRDFEGSDLEAFEFVIRMSSRRNLSSQQKATLAAEAEDVVQAISELIEKERRDRQAESLRATHSNGQFGVSGINLSHTHLSEVVCVEKIPHKQPQVSSPELTYELDVPQNNRPTPRRTAAHVAKQFGTNEKYVQKAQKLRRDDPQSFEAVKQGVTTFQQVAKAKEVDTASVDVNDPGTDEFTKLARKHGLVFVKIFSDFEHAITSAGREFRLAGHSFRAHAQHLDGLDQGGPQNIRDLKMDAGLLKVLKRCPKCDGKKCPRCRDKGYVIGEDRNNILREMRLIR